MVVENILEFPDHTRDDHARAITGIDELLKSSSYQGVSLWLKIEAHIGMGIEIMHNIWQTNRLDDLSLLDESYPDQIDRMQIGDDDRKRITRTRRTPFRYICKLEGPDLGASGNCTGTLISPNKVLTAAHCVEKVKKTPGAIRVIPGKRDSGSGVSSEPFGVARGASVDIATGYTGTPGIQDYAVITLDSDFGKKKFAGKKFGWWKRVEAWPDDRVSSRRSNIAGFPRDLHVRGDHMYWDADRFSSVTGQRMEYFHDTERGMSGSPIWIRWRGMRTIVGVHARRDDGIGPVANIGVHITSGILKEIKSWL